jgi:neutral ceramidase
LLAKCLTNQLVLVTGELLNASINRSPNAYANNPPEERARYTHDNDKEMVLLRLEDFGGAELGAISWFPVHCTSMNNTNRLISGDNKGLASRLMEDWKNGGRRIQGSERSKGESSISKSEAELRRELAGVERMRGGHVDRGSGLEDGVWKRRRLAEQEGTCFGNPGFVAAFAQSNVGDTSPNVLGAFCLDTGEPCAANTR